MRARSAISAACRCCSASCRCCSSCRAASRSRLIASEACTCSSRARRSKDSRSSSMRMARACTALASSSVRTRRSSAATSRRRTEASSPSAPTSFSRSSAVSAAERLAACVSCSRLHRRSASSAWTMLLLFRRCDASELLSLSSSCKAVIRMLRSTFSFVTWRNSSSNSASLLPGASRVTSSMFTAAGFVASLNCCFICSKMARWFSRVFRSSTSPNSPTPDGTMEGRALGIDGLASMRASSSERSWSRDWVLEALPSCVICLSCSVSLPTCFLEASSSDSRVEIF
mmetsp:Transcript_112673/g.313391  ORF Transcript_112673/g.313391 Transcript_112673/m.313391 type:complete len:286 (+) Transcript_112673:1185-2042(+)